MNILKKLLQKFSNTRIKRRGRKQEREQIKSLRDPIRFQQRLAEIDKPRQVDRIYIMGCGRSGTWLLTSLLSSFSDLELVAKELPIEYFGIFKTTKNNLAIKRDNQGYERVEDIPLSIKILWIVRHPYDVLTSHNPNNPSYPYHILPHRFLGEMLALQYLVETKRPNTLIVKYEDLVERPEHVQNLISQAFGLEISIKPSEIINTFIPPGEAARAMHGQRPIDTKSVNKYLNKPHKIQYLHHIHPRIYPCLDWLAREFHYDVRLP
jgi:hypothetical protein